MLRVMLVAAALVALPLASDEAISNGCVTPTTLPDFGSEPYPAHARSPLESLSDHELVFHAEVVVPTKRCSLGACAGLRVLSSVKGKVPETILVRVSRPGEDDACGPDLFRLKGSRWLVFADKGTSKTGIQYLAVEPDGPSFSTPGVPDFHALEADYRMLRARLDGAIEARLGTRTTNR